MKPSASSPRPSGNIFWLDKEPENQNPKPII